jgi:CRISPR-associated endonuclease Cas2
MGRKKQTDMGFVQKVLKLQHAGISGIRAPNRISQFDKIVDINETIHRLFNIVNITKRSQSAMIFFVMYDIESNKVRTLVSKYLEKKGCTRIQKSIFLGDLDRLIFDEIRSDLVDVQSCYENNDSIILVPISTDYLQSMKVIGKSVNVDIITKNLNTLFF